MKPINSKMISVTGSAPVSLKQHNGNDFSSPLFSFLALNGFTLKNTPEGNFLLALNHNREDYDLFIKSGGSKERAILIRLEPVSVFPAQYRPEILQQYCQVITPGLAQDRVRGKFFIGWPYQYHLNPGNPNEQDPSLEEVLQTRNLSNSVDMKEWLSRPTTAVMIAANKVSPLRESNYNLRRQMARDVPSNLLEVYGDLWQGDLYSQIRHRIGVASFSIRNRSIPNPRGIFGGFLTKYPTAKGGIKDKHKILMTSKYALAIENSSTTMSEKLFDTILNGAVPIYVGPSLWQLELPDDLAITHVNSPRELIDFLENVDLELIERILEAGRDFLSSENFLNNWRELSVYRQISDLVISQFRMSDS